MRHHLKLEAIGDADAQFMKLVRAVYPSLLGERLDIKPPRPWVARITGPDPKFGLKREFQKAKMDYSRANRAGTRGIYANYFLSDGIYEVYKMTSWRGRDRHFIRVRNGEAERIRKADVQAIFAADGS